MHLKHEAGEEF